MGPTTRSDLELRLLRASTAVMQSSHQAPQLVREALAMAGRHGFVQTVLGTAPQLVDYLIAGSAPYPHTDHSRALVAAGLQARKLAAGRAHSSRLTDPLTDAEIRGTGEAPPAPDVPRHGIGPAPLAQHCEDPPSSHLYEAWRQLQVLRRQAGELAGPSLTSGHGSLRAH